MYEHDPHEPASEQRLTELFSALDADAAPVDHQFLTRLRERTAQAFAETTAPELTSKMEKRNMSSLLAAFSAIGATAAAFVWFAFFSEVSTTDETPFANILTEVSQVDTLELKLSHDGKDERLWVRPKAKALRWNQTDSKYKIVRGSTGWEVNEAANKATSRSSTLFAGALPGIDFLALLMLPSDVSRDQFLEASSVERRPHAGGFVDVYRWDFTGDAGSYSVEAWVDAKNRMLQSLQSAQLVDGSPRPLATVSVVAVNQPVDEDMFAVAKSLSEDGRVGKITDVQGIVTLKPVMAQRWTPVVHQMLLHPGDWVRTDVRGANAVALRLTSGASITLGPGSLVEVVSPKQVCLVQGELKVAANKVMPVELLGPKDQKLTVDNTSIVRLNKEELTVLDRTPQWLAGFEGSTNNESIGSLVAKVDGRDVPLTVGYHKVSVDIRDQIARTVVEESFVNHTKGRLEGVFYFPLPQDASISGFGMWIGDELVEADVVEKQRAREIYETILRERRDPGLLEWSGGNIFKARVFPIEPRSEKRIKISYTQVLPLRGKQFRYSYGLRSELLKQNPLRELAIDLKLSSEMTLASVHSPTHSAARTDHTPHSAHVEFSAQEYTPDRDFEVVAELADNQPNIVLTPHRRGDDGYFMLQLTPPDGVGQWQRDVIPDGKPLEILILADTSASMDAASRAAQAEFMATLLSSLSPEDKFNLCLCDVECDWVFSDFRQANETAIETARDRLTERASLGWTDLDKAFELALEKAGEDTEVVYVGDGIVTSGDSDPVAFAKRLRRLCEKTDATLHAVSVSSSFEPLVMRAIAAQGGGSVRQISGEHTPQGVAAELLDEITKPTLRNLQVEFSGIQTARVYPRELSNLPVGTQQILLGRYLPQGEDQTGRVTVTGMFGDEPVQFTSEVTLFNVAEASEAEEDSSFIPRLWARMHLDALLEQGGSQTIQDEIIALSEDYHIITPYTSLLVLESDQDRERFKVKRRFQMRDAERFFAEGRDNADYELLGQQMRRAGTWRLGLRRQILAELMGLGRNAQQVSTSIQPAAVSREIGEFNAPWGLGGGAYAISGRRISGELPMRSNLFLGEGFAAITDAPWDGGLKQSLEAEIDAPYQSSFESNSDVTDKWAKDESAFLPSNEWTEISGLDADYDFFAFGADSKLMRDSRIGGPASSASTPSFGRLYAEENSLIRGGSRGLSSVGFGYVFQPRIDFASNGDFFSNAPSYWYRSVQPFNATSLLSTLFPPLPETPTKQQPIKTEQPWPEEIRKLVAGLKRRTEVRNNLRIDRQSETFDPRFGTLLSRSETLELVSLDSWLIRSSSIGSQTLVQWCNEQQRSIFSEQFRLGCQRRSNQRDLELPPVGLPGHLLTSLAKTYHNYRPELTKQDDGNFLLILSDENNPHYEVHFIIDPQRNVLLSQETRRHGRLQSAIAYSDFVEVDGVWWPGRTVTSDDRVRRNSESTYKYTHLNEDDFAAQFAEQLSGLDEVLLLNDPLPSRPEARRALASGKASISDQFTLLLGFAARQQWDQAFEHLEAAERLAKNKRGLRFVRNALLQASRRHEELKQRLLATSPNVDLFLANHTLAQASGVLGSNEVLALLELLKPVFERQPEYVQAMKSWKSNRVSNLRNIGRADEALDIEAELAAQYLHDVSLQTNYARNLFNIGQYDEAYAWLDTVDREEAQWLPHEEQQLRETYIDFLESQGRWQDTADYLARWVASNPATSRAYERYLTALLRLDKEDEMNSLMDSWLQEAEEASGEDAADRNSPTNLRLQAAVNQALGRGYSLYTNRIEQHWFDPLAAIVRHYAQHESLAFIAEQIMNDGNFQNSDQCRQLRREYLTVLREKANTLRPDVLDRLVGWVLANDPAVENDQWQPIDEILETRWSAEQDVDQQHRLGQTLIRILAQRFPEQHLTFLRRQLKEGPEKYRATYASQLFNHLLSLAWTAELEENALGLLERLSDAESPEQRLLAQVQALYRLTDRMVQARFDALMAQVEHQEELTRVELENKKRENMRLAKAGFADRLQQAGEETAVQLRPWIKVERLYLETILGRDLDAVTAECWKYLGDRPPAGESEEIQGADPDPNLLLKRHLGQVLRTRYLVTVANLAVRREADPELADNLLAYLGEAIAQAPAEDVSWKYLKYQLLVALDRPQTLERDLRDWLRADDPLNFWRATLANLLAEQGKLDQAVTLLEAVEADGELGSAEYRTLADWYLVLDRRDKRDQALENVFAGVPEWQLSNWLQQKLNPWQRQDQPLPGELDEDVLRVFNVLFEKSGSPANYAYQLRYFYAATRDFRLLSGLADAMLGHTAERVYPFLQSLNQVFEEVRDEATVDSMVDEIEKVRGKSESTLDQRALDLLEAIVERRASSLNNQPGPHRERALAALRRAFDRKRQPGEARYLADFLANIGVVRDDDFAEEQLRQLQMLHEETSAGTNDRLHIAAARARCLWGYKHPDEAIDLLEAALGEYRTSHNGVLTVEANGPIETYVAYLESEGFYARGEQFLFDELEHPVTAQQTHWLQIRLYQLYRDALANNGHVSLGKGSELLQAVQLQLQQGLDTPDQNHRYQLVQQMCDIYRTAHGKNIPGYRSGLHDFAFQRMPDVLAMQTNNYQSLVQNVGNTLRDVIGPGDGVEFLVTCVEREPKWFQYSNQDGWRQFGHQLGNWRSEAAQNGQISADLQERMLAIVLNALRTELETRSSYNRVLYWKHYSYYWQERESDFRRVAEEVYEQRKESGTAVKYIAEYLWSGLEHYDRAIAMLLTAHRDGRLDETGQNTLVGYLHYRNRYGESIALLEPLVATRPDNISYRTLLMHAYYQTKRPNELLILLQQTDEFFHEKSRWGEAPLAALAYSCLQNQLYAQSVAYYEELIPLYQRSRPNRGIGDGILSSYYSYLADAYAGLQNTSKAVDAACGGIVSWGPRHENRRNAVQKLGEVLHRSPDLVGYIAELDCQVEETGLENPIVRKQLGKVLLEKQQYKLAITQLSLARDAQPDDSETHELLVSCYDKLKDRQGAVEQLLESVELSRRNIELYRTLGNRYAELQQPKLSERAYTSIVEMLPNESESHAMLAEIRQQQDRWDEAVGQWRRVAETRQLEPTGLLKLAAAQIHQQAWEEARETIRKLHVREWPSRFQNVEQEIRDLERQLEQAEKR